MLVFHPATRTHGEMLKVLRDSLFRRRNRDVELVVLAEVGRVHGFGQHKAKPYTSRWSRQPVIYP